jgi:uroporphyrinogen-III synthase
LPTTLLISRPKDDAEALKRAVLAQNSAVHVILAPAIEITPVPYDAKFDGFDAIILTSKHATAAAAKIAPGTTVLCVGDSTAQTARSLGLNAVSAGGTSKDLMALAQGKGFGCVLYLRGKHVHEDLELELNLIGLKTKSRVVYRQDPCKLSDEVIQDLARATTLLVPVYSTRSARILSENLDEYDGAITLVAISKSAADGWVGPKIHQTIYAKAPNSKAMMAAIASQLA